uniref:DZF domain-containing protein n=1 Tax=Macrostomum lignano TaxID=282301 RepID=A0A1I8F739_9PLAT
KQLRCENSATSPAPAPTPTRRIFAGSKHLKTAKLHTRARLSPQLPVQSAAAAVTACRRSSSSDTGRQAASCRCASVRLRARSALKSVASDEAATPAAGPPQTADSGQPAARQRRLRLQLLSSSSSSSMLSWPYCRRSANTWPGWLEYIDELPNEQGNKAVQYHLQTVDPSLAIEVKSAMRANKLEFAQPIWGRRMDPARRRCRRDSVLSRREHRRSAPGCQLATLAQAEPDRKALDALAARCEQALRQVSEQLSADGPEQQQQKQQLNGVMRIGSLAKDVTLFLGPAVRAGAAVLGLAWPHCAADSGQALLLTVQTASSGDSLLVSCSDGSLRCCISLTSVAAKASQLESFVPLSKLYAISGAEFRLGCPAAELLIEKCISSYCAPSTPSEALRRVLECLASGLLLPGGPACWIPARESTRTLPVPCPPRARGLTAAAHRAVRLMAFRQLHRLLDMQRLPAAQSTDGLAEPASSDLPPPRRSPMMAPTLCRAAATPMQPTPARPSRRGAIVVKTRPTRRRRSRPRMSNDTPTTLDQLAMRRFDEQSAGGGGSNTSLVLGDQTDEVVGSMRPSELLQHCEAVSVDSRDERLMCAVNYAIKYQRTEVLRLLLASGASPNQRGQEGVRPVHVPPRATRRGATAADCAEARQAGRHRRQGDDGAARGLQARTLPHRQ